MADLCHREGDLLGLGLRFGLDRHASGNPDLSGWYPIASAVLIRESDCRALDDRRDCDLGSALG